MAGAVSGIALYSAYREFPEQMLYRTQPPIKVKVTERPSAEVEKQYDLLHAGHTVTLNLLPMEAIPQHLQGFEAYIRTLYNGKPDGRGTQIIEQIRKSRMVIGVVVSPEPLDPAPVLGLVSTIAEAIRGIQFIRGTLIDYHDEVILAPDGSFSRKAMIDPAAPAKPWWKVW